MSYHIMYFQYYLNLYSQCVKVVLIYLLIIIQMSKLIDKDQ